MAKKPATKRKPAPTPTHAEMRVLGGDIHQKCADDVLAALHKFNEAVKTASKQGTLVLVRAVGTPKNMQLECEIYKQTHGTLVFSVTPAD